MATKVRRKLAKQQVKRERSQKWRGPRRNLVVLTDKFRLLGTGITKPENSASKRNFLAVNRRRSSECRVKAQEHRMDRGITLKGQQNSNSNSRDLNLRLFRQPLMSRAQLSKGKWRSETSTQTLSQWRTWRLYSQRVARSLTPASTKIFITSTWARQHSSMLPRPVPQTVSRPTTVHSLTTELWRLNTPSSKAASSNKWWAPAKVSRFKRGPRRSHQASAREAKRSARVKVPLPRRVERPSTWWAAVREQRGKEMMQTLELVEAGEDADPLTGSASTRKPELSSEKCWIGEKLTEKNLSLKRKERCGQKTDQLRYRD